MKNISVTEVRNALRCPRLFALGRARSAAVQFPVGSSSLGATFHRLAERFVSFGHSSASTWSYALSLLYSGAALASFKF